MAAAALFSDMKDRKKGDFSVFHPWRKINKQQERKPAISEGTDMRNGRNRYAPRLLLPLARRTRKQQES